MKKFENLQKYFLNITLLGDVQMDFIKYNIFKGKYFKKIILLGDAENIFIIYNISKEKI